jgi:hypothetical protein
VLVAAAIFEDWEIEMREKEVECEGPRPKPETKIGELIPQGEDAGEPLKFGVVISLSNSGVRYSQSGLA